MFRRGHVFLTINIIKPYNFLCFPLGSVPVVISAFPTPLAWGFLNA